MTDKISAQSSNHLQFTLVFDQNDDDEYRDRQARQLLSFCRDWPSVDQVQLATEAAPQNTRVGEFSDIAGEIAVKVATGLIKDFVKGLFSWLKSADTRMVKIKIAETEIEFPADTPAEKVEQWILAVHAQQNVTQEKEVSTP